MERKACAAWSAEGFANFKNPSLCPGGASIWTMTEFHRYKYDTWMPPARWLSRTSTTSGGGGQGEEFPCVGHFCHSLGPQPDPTLAHLARPDGEHGGACQSGEGEREAGGRAGAYGARKIDGMMGVRIEMREATPEALRA
jgi:hypothetical protein